MYGQARKDRQQLNDEIYNIKRLGIGLSHRALPISSGYHAITNKSREHHASYNGRVFAAETADCMQSFLFEKILRVHQWIQCRVQPDWPWPQN